MTIKEAITPAEASRLLSHCRNDIEALALLLWNRGKAKTLESGIEQAKQIREHANQ